MDDAKIVVMEGNFVLRNTRVASRLTTVIWPSCSLVTTSEGFWNSEVAYYHAVPYFVSSNFLPLDPLYFKPIVSLMHDISNSLTPTNISNLFAS